MQTSKKLSLAAVLGMALVSLTNLFGVGMAGASVLIGIAGFFLYKGFEKLPFAGSGLTIQTIRSGFFGKMIWLWLLLPLIIDVLCFVISQRFLPEYLEHVLARTSAFISLDTGIVLVFQLAILALGEEIAWRAFFQQQLQKVLPIVPALLVTSVFFSLGHIADGALSIVLYDIFFVFVNSLIYGVIFSKTHNAWMSAISHFSANLMSVFILVAIQ